MRHGCVEPQVVLDDEPRCFVAVFATGQRDQDRPPVAAEVDCVSAALIGYAFPDALPHRTVRFDGEDLHLAPENGTLG